MNRLRHRSLCFVSVLALLAAGCAWLPGRRDAAEPREISPGAGISRAPAVERLRAYYPARLGRFANTGVREHDGDGNDASVTYRYPGDGKETLASFTAYFYRAPGRRGDDGLEKAVREATRQVTSAHRGARVTGSEPVEIKRDGETRQGRRVTFEYTDSFAGQPQELISELHVYPAAPGRLVKYRITYPAAHADEVRGRLNPFVASFPWPSGL